MNEKTDNLYIYISCVRVCVTELLLDVWTDFDEIFCVSSRGFEDGLDSQFGPMKIRTNDNSNRIT